MMRSLFELIGDLVQRKRGKGKGPETTVRTTFHFPAINFRLKNASGGDARWEGVATPTFTKVCWNKRCQNYIAIFNLRKGGGA